MSSVVFQDQSRFVNALQTILEKYFLRIHSVCQTQFTTWFLKRAYEGALKSIPLMNIDVQELDYQGAEQIVPDFLELLRGAFQNYVHLTPLELKVFNRDTASYFLHTFLGAVSDRLLSLLQLNDLYGGILRDIPEQERPALARYAMYRAMDATLHQLRKQGHSFGSSTGDESQISRRSIRPRPKVYEKEDIAALNEVGVHLQSQTLREGSYISRSAPVRERSFAPSIVSTTSTTRLSRAPSRVSRAPSQALSRAPSHALSHTPSQTLSHAALQVLRAPSQVSRAPSHVSRASHAGVDEEVEITSHDSISCIGSTELPTAFEKHQAEYGQRPPQEEEETSPDAAVDGRSAVSRTVVSLIPSIAPSARGVLSAPEVLPVQSAPHPSHTRADDVEPRDDASSIMSKVSALGRTMAASS